MGRSSEPIFSETTDARTQKNENGSFLENVLARRGTFPEPVALVAYYYGGPY